jgi:hypothetical protein
VSSKYWNGLLHLLWLVLWADGKPCRKKVTAFMDAVIELKYVIDPKAEFTQQDITKWREIHEMPQRAFIRRLSGDVECRALFGGISAGGHALDVITSVVQIALADGTYSDSESLLIKRTILLWEMPEKALVDVNYVCGERMESAG